MLYGLMAGLTSADVVDRLLSTWEHVISPGFDDYYATLGDAAWKSLADKVEFSCEDQVHDDVDKLTCKADDVFCDGLKMQLKCLLDGSTSFISVHERKMLLAVTDLTRLEDLSYEYVMTMDSPFKGSHTVRNVYDQSLLWASENDGNGDGWVWSHAYGLDLCQQYCYYTNNTGFSFYKTFFAGECGCFKDFMMSWRQTEHGNYPFKNWDGSGYLVDNNQQCTQWRNAVFSGHNDYRQTWPCSPSWFKKMMNQLGHTVRPSECNWRCRFMGSNSEDGCNLWKLGGCEVDYAHWDTQCQYWDFDQFRRLEDVGQSYMDGAITYGIPCKGDIWPKELGW